jgi:Fusaric acid resistance protein family
MSRADLWTPGSPQTGSLAARRVAGALWSVGPPLLFGLRLWASVCLALYVAFWLKLDNAYWAGTSAAIVCQPQLGASLRKGWFRMVGTAVGAVAVVILTACFPQDRIGFLLGLVLWGAACGFVATILRSFAAYAAALAGFTAAIVASDELGATGGPNGQAFMLAVTAPAKFASASSARESCSPGPISVAPGAGWPPNMPPCRPRSLDGSPARSCWPVLNSRKRVRFGAT